MAADISVDELTNGSVVDKKWTGDKILDKLISVMDQNIDIQYDAGRIKGNDYASVYLGSMQTVISESIRFLLGADLVNIQIEGERAKNSALLA